MIELGGISMPRTAELAIIAAECPLGYLALVSFGNMMDPMAESVAQALPVMDPKTAQVTMPITPSPPRMRPTKISTNVTSLSPTWARLIRPPAMMKSGMAKITTVFILL